MGRWGHDRSMNLHLVYKGPGDGVSDQGVRLAEAAQQSAGGVGYLLGSILRGSADLLGDLIGGTLGHLARLDGLLCSLRGGL